MKGDKTQCDCGHVAISNGCSTGYGVDNDGKKHCFACCGERDREEMVKTGKAVLYLSNSAALILGDCVPLPKWHVSNWPGTLKLSAYVRTGRHNIAGKRYDAWFTGPDGKAWWGVTYGDNTQICHCRRLRS